jgi:hypothetical protein
VKKKFVNILPTYLELDDQLVHWIEFYTSFIAIFYTYEKYHDSKQESDAGEKFGHLYMKKHQEKYMNWQKWRKENTIFWKEWWKENDDNTKDIYGEYNCDWKWKIENKMRRKTELNYKSNCRKRYHKLQRFKKEYPYSLSKISNEEWKNRWKQEILERYKKLHPTKQKETIYKGFKGLHPKVEKGQFIEVINLDDAPTELVNNSMALRNIKSTKHWESEAKNITSQQIMIRCQATILIIT